MCQCHSHCLSLSNSVSLRVTVRIIFPPYRCQCLSLLESMYISMCQSQCHTQFDSMCGRVSLSLNLSQWLSISESWSVHVRVSVTLFQSHCLSMSEPLSLCVRVSASILLSFCLRVSRYTCQSQYVYLHVRVSIFFSVVLSVCLFLCHGQFLYVSESMQWGALSGRISMYRFVST